MKRLFLASLLSIVGLQAQQYVAPDGKVLLLPFNFLDLCGNPPTLQVQAYCVGRDPSMTIGYLLQVKPTHYQAMAYSYTVRGFDGQGIEHTFTGVINRKDSPLGYSNEALYFGVVLIGKIEVDVKELGEIKELHAR